MGKMQRRKGKSAELEVVRILKKTWASDDFRRSGPGFEGADILTPPDFPWTVEVKHLANLRLMDFWKLPQRLRRCMEQAKSQGLSQGKPWLLCCKIEGKWFGVRYRNDGVWPSMTATDYGLMMTPDFHAVFPLECLGLPGFSTRKNSSATA